MSEFDVVSFTMGVEDGSIEPGSQQYLEGFQHLIDSGLAWQLQGTYGRTAQTLIDAGQCRAPKPQPRHTLDGALPDVGPYAKVSADKQLSFDNGRTFRIVLYGAYNARGLIGSEKNGIAVLDEDNLEVLADEIGREDSGYFGATRAQAQLFERLSAGSFETLRQVVNDSPRCRHPLDAAGNLQGT
ncbi:DUF7417 domain-containing protein [Thioalkalivibrio thiocyanodenitrificans]|uniref:DUF7417 domain-containing protein n=1 Tax=Thioalkalivibrio thiocyanodenitrificans TaxID=243063 RepID=UPI00036E6D8C|nr:hypothetical protein [Thioalkalivibrio thiocyanodenitrificans]